MTLNMLHLLLYTFVCRFIISPKFNKQSAYIYFIFIFAPDSILYLLQLLSEYLWNK